MPEALLSSVRAWLSVSPRSRRAAIGGGARHPRWRSAWAPTLALALSVTVAASATGPPHVQRVLIVVLENADYATALVQPFLAQLAREGALLRNSFAVGRHSLPNYLAMTAGSLHGVASNTPVTLDVPHIGDLLEAHGRTWKVYVEHYPGRCFLGSRSGPYVRRHVPFLHYKNVQANPERCRRIVEAAELAIDIQNGTLPDYSFYVPDLNHDGHNTGVTEADQWLSQTFGPRLKDPRFMHDTLFVVTFDEGRGWWHGNHIYTVFYGDRVIPGAVSDARFDHYSLLRTIEDLFTLGTLGQEDAHASAVTGIWRTP